MQAGALPVGGRASDGFAAVRAGRELQFHLFSHAQ